jgi:hypothetical protein
MSTTVRPGTLFKPSPRGFLEPIRIGYLLREADQLFAEIVRNLVQHPLGRFLVGKSDQISLRDDFDDDWRTHLNAVTGTDWDAEDRKWMQETLKQCLKLLAPPPEPDEIED